MMSESLSLPELNQKIYNDVMKALQESERLRILYKSSQGEETKRTIEPYALYFGQQTWYIHAYCCKRKSFRSFALHRIVSAKGMKQYFSKDEEELKRISELTPFTYHNVYHVEIEASAKVANIIAERQWFPGQQIESLGQDKLLVKYPIIALELLTSWVLSYGGELKLLAPEEARTHLKDKVKKLYDNF